MTVKEYAQKHGLGIREVYRRIELGELETYEAECLVPHKPCKHVLYEGEYIPISEYAKRAGISQRTAHYQYEGNELEGKVMERKVKLFVTCVKHK